MAPQRPDVDGGWVDADPLTYTPGWDLERYAHGVWALYRTSRVDSVEVAVGTHRVGMVLSYVWHRWLRRR